MKNHKEFEMNFVLPDMYKFILLTLLSYSKVSLNSKAKGSY